MIWRKFAVGDRVRLALDTFSNHNPQDVYAISRMLPAQANGWQYRVRREGDSQERAVGESQLVRVVPAQRDERSQFETQQDFQRVRNTNVLRRVRGTVRRTDRDRF